MQLPVELNFLERHLLDGREKYEKPSWLVSDFHDYIWYYDFGYDGGPKRIDWRVMLDDGESLVEKKNENLLLAFKYWLAFSETDNRKSPESIKVSFHATASVIDYILDRSAEFVLSKHGIECLNRNDMIALLEKRASSYILKEVKKVLIKSFRNIRLSQLLILMI